MNASMANHTTYNISRVGKGMDGGVGEVRRHVERLLLRLDFNGGFSKPRGTNSREQADAGILAQGGIV